MNNPHGHFSGLPPSLGANDTERPKQRRGGRRYVVAVILGLIVIIGILFLRRLSSAPPAVERSTLWIDRVKKGTLRREVQGQGTLVPLEVRWLTASAAARVDHVHVLPGSRVEADTVLVDLVNPELERLALEAERQWTQGKAELAHLEASLANQRLAQTSAMATLEAEAREAERRAEADRALAERGFLSQLEMASSRDRAATLTTRRALEAQRLEALVKDAAAQLHVQRQQVEGLRALAHFRRQEVDNLHVRAGVAGVLQDSPLQPGQAVAVGTLIARVASPDKLKAELRIAEAQAKDVALGQKAAIDIHNGILEGHVTRIDPAAVNGTVRVDIQFHDPLPNGARPDLSVNGRIELEQLDHVLYVGRPAFGREGHRLDIFKLVNDDEAIKTAVDFGKASAQSIEVRDGLAEGDRIILSDLSVWETATKLRLH